MNRKYSKLKGKKMHEKKKKNIVQKVWERIQVETHTLLVNSLINKFPYLTS